MAQASVHTFRLLVIMSQVAQSDFKAREHASATDCQCAECQPASTSSDRFGFLSSSISLSFVLAAAGAFDNKGQCSLGTAVMSALPPKADMCGATRRCTALCQKRTLPAYSITLSARSSSVGGTVRPSALAVLRLITSSYLVGACTGRSAGFSPLRMRST